MCTSLVCSLTASISSSFTSLINRRCLSAFSKSPNLRGSLKKFDAFSVRRTNQFINRVSADTQKLMNSTAKLATASQHGFQLESA